MATWGEVQRELDRTTRMAVAAMNEGESPGSDAYEGLLGLAISLALLAHYIGERPDRFSVEDADSLTLDGKLTALQNDLVSAFRRPGTFEPSVVPSWSRELNEMRKLFYT